MVAVDPAVSVKATADSSALVVLGLGEILLFFLLLSNFRHYLSIYLSRSRLRLGEGELRSGGQRKPSILADVVEDWSGVRDADDKPLPYSEDALRALCRIPGVAAVAFRTYLAEVGAKEKN